MKEEVCTQWKELSKIDFSFYDSKEDSKKKISKREFFKFVKDNLNEKDKVIINGGTFIPSTKKSKNALKTWKLSCNLANELNKKGIDSKVSLIIDDLPFTSEERKEIKIELPKEYKKYARKLNIETINPYTEKVCANRYSSQKKSKKWQLYPKENKLNYCISTIIYYLRDTLEKGTTTNIWVAPKCSSQNLIKAIDYFNRYEKKSRNLAFFYTNNCFK